MTTDIWQRWNSGREPVKQTEVARKEWREIEIRASRPKSVLYALGVIPYGSLLVVLVVSLIIQNRWNDLFDGLTQFLFWWGVMSVGLCVYLIRDIDQARTILKERRMSKPPDLLFTIKVDAVGQESIKCHKCNMTSYNPNDVKNKYCGNCHIFFEDEIAKNTRRPRQ